MFFKQEKKPGLNLTQLLLAVLIGMIAWLIIPGLSDVYGTTPPSVNTNPATNITSTSATLNGLVTDLGPYCHMDTGFDWGRVNGGPYPNQATGPSLNSLGNFSANINGLNPLTTYYFIARGTAWGMGPCVLSNFIAYASFPVTGQQLSFTTLALAKERRSHEDVSPTMSPPSPANIYVKNVNVSSPQVSTNQEVTVYVNVKNAGEVDGGFTAVLKINGQVEQTKAIALSGMAATPVQFTIYKNMPGTYEVDVNGQKTYFTVIGSGNSEQPDIRTIVIILLALVAISLAIIIIKRYAIPKSN
jgi:hypothetical protein